MHGAHSVKRHRLEIECGVLWSTIPEHLLFWQLQSSLDHSFCVFTAQSCLGVQTWAWKGGWLSEWRWLPLRCLAKQTCPCLALRWAPHGICFWHFQIHLLQPQVLIMPIPLALLLVTSHWLSWCQWITLPWTCAPCNGIYSSSHWKVELISLPPWIWAGLVSRSGWIECGRSDLVCLRGLRVLKLLLLPSWNPQTTESWRSLGWRITPRERKGQIWLE